MSGRGAWRTVLGHLGLVGLFSLPAVLVFWHAWAGHLSSTVTCACSDAAQQVWFIAWPAYALSHGADPFFSSAVWVPHGANLLANASFPLVGLILAPVTWAWGPVASTNLALTLAPGLSSWGCWVACRRFTSWPWAAAVGALVFGYSPFVMSNARQGHLGLALLVFPPLMLALVYRMVVLGATPVWRSGVGLGLLAVAQALVSAEVLVMTCLVAVVAVVAATVTSVRSWSAPRLRSVLGGFGTTLVVAGAGLAVPAWFVLRGPRHIVGSASPGLHLFGNSLGDLWAVTARTVAATPFAPGGQDPASLGITGPDMAYVGVPLLVAAAVSVIVARRRRITWVLVATGAASFVLSLGTSALRDDALRSVTWLPWQSLGTWPLLDDVLPGRFAAFVDLSLAILVALGVDGAWRWICRRVSEVPRRPMTVRPTRLRGRRSTFLWAGSVLVVSAAVAIVPVWARYAVPATTESVVLPGWFATTARQVPAQSVVLTYPFPSSDSLASEPMLWQAVLDMHVRLAGGYLKVPGHDGHVLGTQPPGSAISVLDLLTLTAQVRGRAWVPSPSALAALRRAVEAWDVSYVVVTTTGPNPVFAAAVMTAAIGRLPALSQGSWVWDVHQHPLNAGFRPVAAAAAFARCLHVAALYGVTAVPTQQTNQCVLTASG